MNFQQIISSERDRFAKCLVQTRSEIESEFPGAVSEILISVNAESKPYPYRYLRVDVMASAADGTPKLFAADMDVDPKFVPARYQVAGVDVQVNPFTWNALQIAINRQIADLTEIERWASRWLDVEQSNVEDDDGLTNVIHSISQLERAGDWWAMDVDLGSASSDALFEFISILADHGVTQVILQNDERD